MKFSAHDTALRFHDVGSVIPNYRRGGVERMGPGDAAA